MSDVYEDDVADLEYDVDAAADVTGLERFATLEGDISAYVDDIDALGMKVVSDWNRDKNSNQTWRDLAEQALKSAAQDNGDIKTFPWANASRVNYPILTVAAQQFASRAYQAIVKGDEAVGVKVVGTAPQAPDLPEPPPGQQSPPEMQAIMQGVQQAMDNWKAKQARAQRVKTWMNYHLFYGMDDWEGGTDTLLNQLPIIGMAFKKIYFDPHRGVCSDYVNALHLTVPPETQSLDRCPRVTQDYTLYPYEIKARQATGVFRDVEIPLDGDDEQAARVILEQHRLEDLDEDGIEEPYIITVDEQTNEVLRIEAAFGPEDIAYSKQGDQVAFIRRWMPFIAFPFMPDPEGKFYGIGFGQLLAPLNAVINTSINQLMDAGTAAAAGGGFIGGGLRLQGAGQTTTLRFSPGEYKYVQGTGQDLKASIWERTVPNPSPVLFQLLDLVLGAAKEIASIKDVLTGDSPATAPVGTTLALIDQGLQSFAALYKRIYRSMRAEFRAIYECQGKWGSEQEYQEVLDNPGANLREDFNAKSDDIVPVSDPNVVTRAQALAKAQVVQQVAAGSPPGVFDPKKVALRVFEAAQIEDADELFAPPPKGPPPGAQEEIDKTKSETVKNLAQAKNYEADAAVKTGEAQQEAAFAIGQAIDPATGATDAGGIPNMAGQPSDAMGGQGAPGGGGPEPGVVGGFGEGLGGGGEGLGGPGGPGAPPAGL